MDTQRRAPPEQLLDVLRPLHTQRLVHAVRQVGVVEKDIPSESLCTQGSGGANSTESEDTVSGLLKTLDEWCVDVHPRCNVRFALLFIMDEDATAQGEGEGKGMISDLSCTIVCEVS